jgi:nicotinamide mononucleotide transporter
MIQPSFELVATCAGLMNVYLAARASKWNWFFGIITVTLYMIIFFQVKLYCDMCLQIVFLGLQVYGIVQWSRGGHQSLQVTKAGPKIQLVALGLFSLLFILFIYLLKSYTDSTTIVMDAFITALSLVAQWMMCKKWLENWWLWMVVDIVSIKMYLIKHLYLTSGLYAAFFIICCFGYRVWQRQLKS